MNKRIACISATPTSRLQHPMYPSPIALATQDVCDAIAASIFATQLIDEMFGAPQPKPQKKNPDAPKKTTNSSSRREPMNQPCPCPCRIDSTKGVSIVSTNVYGTTTVIKWSDGTKTIAVCDKDDTFNPEAGFAIAVAKKFMGNAAFHEAITQIQENITSKNAKVTNDNIATSTDNTVTSDESKDTKNVVEKQTDKKTTSKKK